MKYFKLAILSIVVLIYSVASTGLLVKAHYCCGDLKSISLVTPKSCCGKNEKSKGCCHNETKYFKVKDKQIQSDEIGEVSPVLAVIHPVEIYVSAQTYSTAIDESNSKIYDPPPLHFKTPIFIKNRVLII